MEPQITCYVCSPDYRKKVRVLLHTKNLTNSRIGQLSGRRRALDIGHGWLRGNNDTLSYPGDK